MLRQIEKIQKMVNSLLGRCADAGADVMEVPADQKYEELGAMILKAQDGELPRRSWLEMQRWLVNDSEALRYYINFNALTVLLRYHFNSDRAFAALSCDAGASSPD